MTTKKMIDKLQLKLIIADALINKHYGHDKFLKPQYVNISNSASDYYYSFCNELAEKLANEFFEN